METMRKNEKELAQYFSEHSLHKGNFILVSELDGSFLAENTEEILKTLKTGEKLKIVQIEENKDFFNCNLKVLREDGTFMGQIPYRKCLVINMLIRRNVKVSAYLECFDNSDDLFSVGVSVYCEDY